MAELSPSHKNITAELPLDAIRFELLPRLPVKSLVRFMCVCKQWQSLISSPEFARIHLRYITMDESRTHHKLLLLDSPSHTFRTLDCEDPYRSSPTTRSIPFQSHPDDLMILASLDGLVCVTFRKTHELMFWNPLTNAYKKLSNCNDHHHRGFYDIYSDAIGFYRDSSNDYKLLHMVYDGELLGAYIYSWRLDSWRKLQSLEKVKHVLAYRCSTAIFYGESLYFMVRDESIRGECHIIIFDVKSEEFRELRFPHVPRGALVCGNFVVVNGYVHLCISYQKEGIFSMQSEIDMWRMDCDRWIKVAAFNGVEGIPLTLRPIYIMRDGNWLAFKKDTNFVYKTDLKDFRVDRLSSYRGCWVFSLQQAIYVETLVPPNP